MNNDLMVMTSPRHIGVEVRSCSKGKWLTPIPVALCLAPSKSAEQASLDRQDI
jgi:hypothetical protein